MEGICVNFLHPAQFFHIFSDYSRDIAMATNFVAKLWQNYLPTLHLSLCHSETEWNVATSMCALTAQVIPLNRVKIS